MMRSYKDLEIWKTGMLIVKDTYKLAKLLPQSEVFGLRSQMTRAAVSIPSNISEGYRRGTEKEFMHFLFQSLGSTAELETQCLIVKDIFQLDTSSIFDKTNILQPQIMTLIKKIKLSKIKNNTKISHYPLSAYTGRSITHS